jgi:dihydroorotase
MPNLKPPITTVAQALEYRKRLLAAVPKGIDFEPLMTLYLTDDTTARELGEARRSGLVHAVKYYPAGATTNSADGVTDIKKVYPLIDKMEDLDLPLLLHGEVTDPSIDIFDREAVFIERVLEPLRNRNPGLRIVFEHATTKEAVDYVMQARKNLAATITEHHLLANRNSLFAGGICPHNHCLPVPKREKHRLALLEAATSGDPRFFLGTDGAPHSKMAKEAACGCAGCYTAHTSIEHYAEAFDSMNALDRLEYFASHAGADFYRLPRNKRKITLVRESWQIPETLSLGSDSDIIVPWRAGEMVQWKLTS